LYIFFGKEIKELYDKFVYVHPPGFNELVSESYIKRFIHFLEEKQYDKVRFLNETGIETLPGNIMRID